MHYIDHLSISYTQVFNLEDGSQGWTVLTQGYRGSQLAVYARCKQMLKDANATDEVGPIGSAVECSCV